MRPASRGLGTAGGAGAGGMPLFFVTTDVRVVFCEVVSPPRVGVALKSE
jgi:hypothetical protein